MVVGGAAVAGVKRLLAVVRLRPRSWQGNWTDCKWTKEHKSEKFTANKNTLTNQSNKLLSGSIMAVFLKNVLKLHCCVSNIYIKMLF